MIDKGRFTTSLPAGCTAGKGLADEEDFDTLLAGSSLGSEQAMAIRGQVPAAAREHAQRVLDGEEQCAPVEGDIDDAVGGLVNGLVRRPSAGTIVVTPDSGTVLRDLLIECKWNPGRESVKLAILAACQTDVLANDQRLHLLQALLDHDAFAGLRTDVAWTIINRTFDLMPETPTVLRRCAHLVVAQVDVSTVTGTWFFSGHGQADQPFPLLEPRLAPAGQLTFFAASHREGREQIREEIRTSPGPTGGGSPAPRRRRRTAVARLRVPLCIILALLMLAGTAAGVTAIVGAQWLYVLGGAMTGIVAMGLAALISTAARLRRRATDSVRYVLPLDLSQEPAGPRPRHSFHSRPGNAHGPKPKRAVRVKHLL